MARTVPGSGAVIEPIFNDEFGVRAVKVIDGGSEYDSSDPPRLTVTGCGTPVAEALLYPIIDDGSGRITHVRVLESGKGYDPLRLSIIPEQDTPNVVSTFDINKIWQSDPNSSTSGVFLINNGDVTDRLTITSDNHPKPVKYGTEREPGGGPLEDQTFSRQFVYRGGKDVPYSGDRPTELNKPIGIMANGVLLHTPDWGSAGGPPAPFSFDIIPHDFLLNTDTYDAVVRNNQYYYHTHKLINQFDDAGGVFENGFKQQFTWTVKTEHDNVLVHINNIDETLNPIEEGRLVERIGEGVVRGQIAKIIRVNGVIDRLYLREVVGEFADGDQLLGSTGFSATIRQDPVTFPNGLFYIEFGPDAHEFGNFIPNTYYLAPTDIRVQRNYQIIWNQSDSSNQPSEHHTQGHPMRFSTTPDGPLNPTPGTLYYDSTGASGAPAADYENEFRPVFTMNADETNRIYYYCGYHRHMSGYTGDEGYMILSPEVDDEPLSNDYYITDYYIDGSNIDYSRHVTGHSRILGISFDGYPIYGPYGYNSAGSAVRQTSSYRLKNTNEIDGQRPPITTTGTITHTVTVSNGKFAIDGTVPPFLQLDRGKTYIFNQDAIASPVLFALQEDGWHIGNPPDIGNTQYLFQDGIRYFIDNVETTYLGYVQGFAGATNKRLEFTPKINSPRLLYVISYANPEYGFRCVQDGYLLGSFVQDYIFEDGLGTLDRHNGRFAVTPDYPNGTYAYFMSTDSSDNPVYPYVIGPEFYGEPYHSNETLPAITSEFPVGAKGEVVLNPDGSVGYVRMVRSGDGYFGPAKAKIIGGEGSGATAVPTVQTVTGLTLLQEGREFATPPTLIFEGGGGGQGARGRAQVNSNGKVTSINIVDEGEFYQQAPYVLITGGGGIGAKAVARVDQGVIVGIDVIDPGEGYINPPNIIFTKLVNLKRTISNRQSYNSTPNYLTGLLRDASSSDTTLYVDNTDAYPGSGSLIIGRETVSYTSKSRERFFNVTRGKNFKYDQRVILDANQNNNEGDSTYQFNVNDRVIRRIENENNKIAKVYDWNPTTRELLVTFEVDELAFIDAGIPTTEDAIVQFDAGVSTSATGGFDPHVLLESVGDSIVTLTEPIGLLEDRKFEDDDELDGVGDGIADLVNTGTDYENQISLDGGLYNSLYGIEETIGGQNTTLFQVGDQVKDASIPFRYATITAAGGLNEGVPHEATVSVVLDLNSGNGSNYFPEEIVTGDVSGVRGTVTSWNPSSGVLLVRGIIPFDTTNLNVGVNGILYKFSDSGTIIDYIVQNPGNDYSATPSISVENAGDIQATATAVMTTAGDQIASVTVNNGGYGYEQYTDGTYNSRPTITVTNDAGDSTGNGAVIQAILGGEMLSGSNGASYRIKRLEFNTEIRSE
jgi:hypothetical protein